MNYKEVATDRCVSVSKTSCEIIAAIFGRDFSTVNDADLPKGCSVERTHNVAREFVERMVFNEVASDTESEVCSDYHKCICHKNRE